jgi:hypothetical protein
MTLGVGLILLPFSFTEFLGAVVLVGSVMVVWLNDKSNPS